MFLFEHIAHNDGPVLHASLLHTWEAGRADSSQWYTQRALLAKVQAETFDLPAADDACQRIG